jgi:RNA recognition motif-containing protein
MMLQKSFILMTEHLQYFKIKGRSMRLLIRNLNRTTTETELRTIFETHGTVQSCTLVMDKKTGGSKGFGFIEMPRSGDAKIAMKSLNGTDVAGSQIRVKKAEPIKNREINAKPDQMKKPPVQNPLDGVTLEMMIIHLVKQHGWKKLGRLIKIKCFTSDPSIVSSLKFLRKTPWARQKVEELYLRTRWSNKK